MIPGWVNEVSKGSELKLGHDPPPQDFQFLLLCHCFLGSFPPVQDIVNNKLGLLFEHTESGVFSED